MTAAAGFLLAAKGKIDFLLFAFTLLGTALIIASSCVINNVIDRGIDKKMTRTKKRSLVTGDVQIKQALIYAAVLLLGGFWVLACFTNWLTVAVGFGGVLAYVVFYSIFKRRSAFGTLVGSISGAMPPLAGYLAVSNQLDLAVLFLFLILCFWQMPHFYAISIYRKQEYASAGLPVWPIRHGLKSTKRQMIGFIILYIVSVVMLNVYGYTGWSYLISNLGIGAAWLVIGLKGFLEPDSITWGKKVFGMSLLVISVFSLSLYLNAWIP